MAKFEFFSTGQIFAFFVSDVLLSAGVDVFLGKTEIDHVHLTENFD